MLFLLEHTDIGSPDVDGSGHSYHVKQQLYHRGLLNDCCPHVPEQYLHCSVVVSSGSLHVLRMVCYCCNV